MNSYFKTKIREKGRKEIMRLKQFKEKYKIKVVQTLNDYKSKFVALRQPDVYHLYDCENIGIPQLHTLKLTDYHYLFLGRYQNSVDPHFSCVESELKEKIQIFKLDMSANNALDCYLSCQLGILIEKHPKAIFFVHSEDRDYDALIDQMKKRGVQIYKQVKAPRRISKINSERIEELSNLSKEKKKKIKDFLKTINSLPDEKLPATKETFCNYIVNNGLQMCLANLMIKNMDEHQELRFADEWINS